MQFNQPYSKITTECPKALGNQVLQCIAIMTNTSFEAFASKDYSIPCGLVYVNVQALKRALLYKTWIATWNKWQNYIKPDAILTPIEIQKSWKTKVEATTASEVDALTFQRKPGNYRRHRARLGLHFYHCSTKSWKSSTSSLEVCCGHYPQRPLQR